MDQTNAYREYAQNKYKNHKNHIAVTKSLRSNLKFTLYTPLYISINCDVHENED